MLKNITLLCLGFIAGAGASLMAQPAPWQGGDRYGRGGDILCNVSHGDNGRGGVDWLNMNCRRYDRR